MISQCTVGPVIQFSNVKRFRKDRGFFDRKAFRTQQALGRRSHLSRWPCSSANGQPEHLRGEPEGVSKLQRLYDLSASLFTEDATTNPPSVPANTSVETIPSEGDEFKLGVPAVGSMPGSAPRLSGTRACTLDFRNVLKVPVPPSLPLFWVFPRGCLQHLRTE